MKKRKRTTKSKYKHESTGDYCTCAAYVAEIMCKRNAERKNQGSLPHKFWNKKPWDWTFKKQMFAANKILKEQKITEQALVKAIHSDEFKSIFSQNFALLGIAAIPPYAILTFSILFFIIVKLNAAQTEDISSSNLLEILQALKMLCFNIGILTE